MADYDFRNAAEMLSLCDRFGMSISELMLQREMELGSVSWQLVMEHVDECLRVMDGATKRAGEDPVPSMGGLIGGEARKLRSLPVDKCVLGKSLHKAVIYALAVAETNASMGVIVAAPTAGAAGILPAALLAQRCGVSLIVRLAPVVCLNLNLQLVPVDIRVQQHPVSVRVDAANISAVHPNDHLRGGLQRKIYLLPPEPFRYHRPSAYKGRSVRRRAGWCGRP